MFAKIAERLTQQLENENVIIHEKRELYRYGFQNGLILTLNFLTSIIVGVALGEVLSSILLLTAYIPLRSYAGGYHSNTSGRCYIVSTLIMIVWICLIKFKLLSTSCCVIMLVIGSCVCFVFSPVAGENKPLDELECKMYRRKSLLILLVEIIIWIIFTCVAKIESEVIPIIIFTEALMLLLGKIKNIRYKKVN